jgi:hypothetical protein
VRGKIIILVAMLAFLVYGSSTIYAQNAFEGYDLRYRPLLGGTQIEITKAAWYGPSFSKGFCSLGFPVNFTENNVRKYGYITAGHCIETANGGDYIDQPRKASWWDWSNFIGRGIRMVDERIDNRADAGLIRIEGSGHEGGIGKHIYEDGLTARFRFDFPDATRRVGILDVKTPFKEMERNENYILYKSGRTTGLTYGVVLQYDYRAKYRAGDLYPTLLITKLNPKNNTPYYDGPIAGRGDSGGPVYMRILIYPYFTPQYGAIIYGITTSFDPARPNNDPNYMVASWAIKVKEIWPDISFITCGYGPSCW